MIYCILSGVFLTLFLLLGTWSFLGFLELKIRHFPLTWDCAQHVIVLTVITILCFIAAVLFGTQIPDYYGY